MAEEPKPEIKGVEQVIKNLSKYKKNLVDEIVVACQAVQQKVVLEAQAALYPGHGYVTGNLRGSIQPSDIEITDDDIVAMVAANAEYASFVEYGTGRSREIPFLRPALLQNLSTFRNAIKAAVSRAEAA